MAGDAPVLMHPTPVLALVVFGARSRKSEPAERPPSSSDVVVRARRPSGKAGGAGQV